MIEQPNLINLEFATTASGWTILVRLLVGLIVFFPEGIQKLIFPDILGAGRFAHIGIPYREVMGPFVGVFETLCGALVVIRTAHASHSHPAQCHHDRRDSFEESPDLAGPRLLDFSGAKTFRVTGFGAWLTKLEQISLCCSDQFIS